MKVITFNCNGIRSAAKKGFFDWLAKQDADVVCLQETKAQMALLPDPTFRPEGWHVHYFDALKAGYSGTGLLTRRKPDRVLEGLGWKSADEEGRWLQADFDADYGGLSVVSIYLPSGSSSEERQQVKFDFLERIMPHLDSLRRKRRQWIIAGDWNIAHKEIDLENWRGNQKNSGFLPEERAWMDKLFGVVQPGVSRGPAGNRDAGLGPPRVDPEHDPSPAPGLGSCQLFGPRGWVDAFRVVNQEPRQYTWWSQRGGARARNVGWRIDYQVVSPGLADKVREASIYTGQMLSDHAPLTIDYAS